MIGDQSFTQIQTQQCNNQINNEQNNSPVKADIKVQVGTLEIENAKHPIYKGINLIGRHPKCHIVIPHLTVSKRHAEIEADDKETIFIMDLQSSNGTMINQKLLKPNKSYQLVPKNKLSFGEVSAIFDRNDDDKNFLVPEIPCQNNLKQSSNSSINTSKGLKNHSIIAEPVSRSVSLLENTTEVKLKKKNEPNETITRRHSDSLTRRKSKKNESIQSDDDIFDSSVINDSRSTSVKNSSISDVSPSVQNDPKSSSVKDNKIFDVTTQHYHEPSVQKDPESSNVKDSSIFDVTTQHYHEPSVQKKDPESSNVKDSSIFDVTTQNHNDEKNDLAAEKDPCKRVEIEDTPNSSEIGSSLKSLFGEASTSNCTESNGKNLGNIKMTLEEEKVEEEKENDDIIPESDDEPLNEEDDLFKDLPKFRIPNTLSNPASPTSEISNSSDDLPAQNLTPRTLKFKEVMKSLKTSKVFKQVDDGLDEILTIGSRLLKVKSAYDIVDPVSGERSINPAETRSSRGSPKKVENKTQPQNSLKKVENKTQARKSPKKVESMSQPAKRGRKKKENLETTISSKMSPLAIEKINKTSKSEVTVKDLRIVLQNLDESIISSQEPKISHEEMDVDTTEVVSNKVAELPSTRRSSRKSTTKLIDFTNNSNVDVKVTENETKNGTKSRRKRNVEEKEETVAKNQAQSKKMKIEKTQKVEIEQTSPVISRRSSRRSNLNVSLNHSFNQTLNRSASDLSKSPLNISIQSSRRTKFKVLFTGIETAKWKKSLTKLGVSEATDIATCSVLLTDKVRRTVKFLCALGRGIPIISIKWLEDSAKSGECLNFYDYILEDNESEKKFGFNLRESLEAANNKKLFEGFTILLTPKITAPPINDLKEIIKTAGGSALTSCPRRWPNNIVIVSTKNDIENARKFAAKAPNDVTIHSTELVLTGILRQKMDLQSFLIDSS